MILNNKIEKGRLLIKKFENGGKTYTPEPIYVKSKSRSIAHTKLNDKLRAEGYTNGTSDPRAPQYKLSQDTKTGDYIYRKFTESK